ncbi:MAG: AAA family ATPase [Planctomycetota bacterium]|nr:AAA family ATPase [Planctomycetota bacterium]
MMIDWINDLFEQELVPVETSVLPRGIERSLMQLLQDCQSLYASAGRRILEYGSDSTQDSQKYLELLADLHRGVVVKTLVEIAHADRQWNQPEREVAMIVLRHVWGVQIDEEGLYKALQNVVKHAEVLKWSELCKPFLQHGFLRHESVELRSLVVRLANVIAKADGRVSPAEMQRLEKLTEDLTATLESTSRVNQSGSQARIRKNAQILGGANAAVVESIRAGKKKDSADDVNSARASIALPAEEGKERMFQGARQELDSLIGLDSLKEDVKQLMDFLQVQKARKEHGLPNAAISFHAVFEGNPGTGKTTVARIISRLLCGLGILEAGHTVETDRSGMVAQYAGQTGPRTSERVDEAMGGVLFIDEAYSLVSEQGEDAYGVEAVQTLLKRMEDDRDRFVVVIAGYPRPMAEMLKSNPGLSSRFQRTYSFPDYSPKELLRIFYTFCRKYHYRLPKPTRIKLLKSFDRLLKQKDESFGNGRVARNMFEDSIQRLSTRIVGVSPLTKELLTNIEPEDVVLKDT